MGASKFYNSAVLAVLLVLLGLSVDLFAMDGSPPSDSSVFGGPGAPAARPGQRNRRGRGRFNAGPGNSSGTAAGAPSAAPSGVGSAVAPSFKSGIRASLDSASSESAPSSARVFDEPHGHVPSVTKSVSPSFDFRARGRLDGASPVESGDGEVVVGSAPSSSFWTGFSGLGAGSGDPSLSSAVVPWGGRHSVSGAHHVFVSDGLSDDVVGRIAGEVVRRLRGNSIASGASSSGSESDGDIEWEGSIDVVSPTGKAFKNIKIFENICKRESSSFILFRNLQYCLLVGADSKGPDVEGVPPPCLQVLLVLNPQLAKKYDCEYWAEYAGPIDANAWPYSNMLATSLEFLAKKLCVLSPDSSRSERENGGRETATIGSPHRHFWSTRLHSAGEGLRRVELDEACLLLNSRLWNDLFCMFVKKMWVKKRGGDVGHSRDPEKCWTYLLANKPEFKTLIAQWDTSYNAYFSVEADRGESPLSLLCELFPQREGWTSEKPVWLKTERWLA